MLMGMIQGGQSTFTGGGTTFTTLNPSDKAATVSLTGGNLILTSSAGAGSARSIANHTTGKYYCEMTTGTGNNSYDHAMCIANVSASLTAGPGSPDTNSAALYSGDAVIYVAGAASGSSDGTYTGLTADIVSMAADLDNHRLWYRVNGGNWNNSSSNDPATNTGGADISAIAGAIYVMSYAGVTNAANTFNFGASAYSFTPPSGFGNW